MSDPATCVKKTIDWSEHRGLSTVGTKTVGVLVKLSRLKVEGSLKGHMMSVPVKYFVELQETKHYSSIAFDET